MACVKRRRGKWVLDWRDSAKRRHWLTFDTKKAAEDMLAEKIAESRQPAPVGDPEMTLGQAFERYFAAKARKRSLQEDRRQSKHLLAEFGKDTKLRTISGSRITLYREKRLVADSVRRKDAKGKPTKLSAASINRPLALLRHLLRLAHDEWGVLRAAPKVKLEKEPQGRVRWLEPDAEARLLDACRKSSQKSLTSIVTMALETGMRKGELLGLTWDRVDMSRGVIRLEVTKSGKRREVPMRQGVYDLLAAFPEPREGHVFSDRNLRPFEEAVAEAKVDDFTFHDCRHHFASWFVMRGGRLEALQKILGHATLAMTMRYAHLSPDFLRSEIAKTERASGSGSRMVATSSGPDGHASQVAYTSDGLAERRGSSEAEQLIRNQ
jgi:integrase